jgi:hypothetical protein
MEFRIGQKAGCGLWHVSHWPRIILSSLHLDTYSLEIQDSVAFLRYHDYP